MAEVEKQVKEHVSELSDKLASGSLKLFNSAHVYTHGSIKLQRTSSGCNLRISVYHTYFFSELVNKNDYTI